MTERELNESTGDDLEYYKDDTVKSKIGEVGLLTSDLDASLNNRNITGGTNEKASGIFLKRLLRQRNLLQTEILPIPTILRTVWTPPILASLWVF